MLSLFAGKISKLITRKGKFFALGILTLVVVLILVLSIKLIGSRGLAFNFGDFFGRNQKLANGKDQNGKKDARSFGADKDKEDHQTVFGLENKPIYLPPVAVAFKNKSIKIEEVGVEEGGFLGVPTSWHTAGWYKDGAKAGEEGNVIIDGHYDTNTGSPGAFWELKDLQVGDKVSLTDSLGRRFEYLVTQKYFIDINDPQRAKVFESSTEKELTLITCGGVWDYANKTYNKRLVIKAKFDKMEKNW